MKPRAFLTGLPAAVLVCALAAICLHFHSAWPWGLPVHEDGRHTLAGTVFYFEHAAGELPVEILLSLAIAGAMRYRAGAARAGGRLVRAAAGSALAVDGLILLGSVRNIGLSGTLYWVGQYHTRDGVPLEFGSHWRYHWLSEGSLMLLAMALAVAAGSNPRGSRRLLPASWIAFAALTLAFGLSLAPFTDPRYLGHQARETLTHALTSVPLAVGVCMYLAGRPAEHFTLRSFRSFPAAGFLILALYQAAGAVSRGIGPHAQTTDPFRLVCTHFFEHSFSLLVVPLHAAWFYAPGGRTRTP